MLEFSINLRRAAFHLQLEGRFSAEWTVIFGPSGAGKSTLLRVLAGLEEGAQSIQLDSNEISQLKAGRRKVSMVSQHPALFPHMSVSSNVGFALHRWERSVREERIREVLALTEAEHLLNTRVQHLSGGEAQKIALARALSPTPRLLLLDEPFSALDGKAADALLERLQPWLRDRGVQVIQATHDATDAFLTGAEAVLMREGRLAAQGPAQEILREERERLERSLRSTQRFTSTGSISS